MRRMRGGGGSGVFTWNSYGGDGLRLAQRVHLHVLEGLGGGRLEVPATTTRGQAFSLTQTTVHVRPHLYFYSFLQKLKSSGKYETL